MAALTMAQIEEIAKTRTLTKAERTRKSNLKMADKRREEQKAAYHADPEKHRAYIQARRKADPAKQAAYAAKGRLKRLAKDPDSERRAIREWREKHPDWNREYAAANPEIIQAQGRRRRARQYGAAGSHTTYEINMLMVRQANLCANPYCRVDLRTVSAQLDHRVALACGGTDDITNLQWLCRPCNARKNKLSESEWLAREERRAKRLDAKARDKA